MQMKIQRVLFLLNFVFLNFIQNTYAQEDKTLYYQAIRNAKAGNPEFAFIDLYSLIEKFPESKFLKGALFATGEYYFSQADYRDARESFQRLINKFPLSEGVVFALVYMLEVAKKERDIEAIDRIKKEILTSQQLSLLFRDFKEYEYHSPLAKNYKAVYYIDRIEFYIDAGLFAEVPY